MAIEEIEEDELNEDQLLDYLLGKASADDAHAIEKKMADDALQQLFQSMGQGQLSPDYIQQRLREIFPRGAVQFDNNHFYFNRNEFNTDR